MMSGKHVKVPHSVVVIVLVARPKVPGLKPGQDDGFLRAIKIRSTFSFGGEVKPETPCCNIRILRI
jgi:hypothetical protein